MKLTAFRTLLDAFRDEANRHPDQPALTFLDARLGATAYTFAELHTTADALASGLRAQRLDPRAPLGILAESMECQVLHYLAALAAGLVPAILTPPSRKFDRAYYVETMQGVLGRCGFGALISDMGELSSATRVLRPFTFEPLGGRSSAAGDDVSGAAFLQFSSGTTGIKRGVLVSQSAVLAQLDTYSRAIGLATTDCIASWLPLYHDMGFITSLNMPLALGVHVVMMQPLAWIGNPAMYLQAVSRYRASLGWHPNFAFAFMAERVDPQELEDVRLSSLRGLVNCSEPVTWESQERFRRRFAPFGLRPDVFLGCYAMAETTFALTHGSSRDQGYLDDTGPLGASPPGQRRPLVSTGRALDGVSLLIVDEQGTPLADRQVGEIWARCPFAFSGYYNNPAATADAVAEEWYRTGDLGYRVGQDVFVCGRKKDLLVVNGVNVYPQDVEDIVSSVDGVQPGRVVTFSVFDERLHSDRIVVLAEPAPASLDDGGWMIEARRRLAAAIQLTAFEIHAVPRGWLVKSSAGKIARGINRRKWLAGRQQML